MDKTIAIVGGGLAGTELAYQLSLKGVKSTIYEARLNAKPQELGLTQKTSKLGELVCSNSFRGQSLFSGAGLLKAELKKVNSLLLNIAEKNSIPAGSSLTLDRELFSTDVTNYIQNDSNITLVSKVISNPEELLKRHSLVVIAVGPTLIESIKPWFKENFGENLYFYDAIAPILNIDSLDMSICFWGARNSEEKSYLNAPFTKEEYYNFVEELKNGQMVDLHSGDDSKFFMGCMPVEELAKSGPNTLRFSPMRGDGLIDPRTQKNPYAVVQLRPEGLNSDAYGMVGFQTRLLYGEQERIFSKIPGFKNLEFIKHGSMHRNTYINAPKELNDDMSLKKNSNIFLAGQISGVEGYIESIAHGIIVANEILLKLDNNRELDIVNTKKSASFLPLNFPVYTSFGALKQYLRVERKKFQPSKINFGLFPALEDKDKRNLTQNIKKKLAYREVMSKRALAFYKN